MKQILETNKKTIGKIRYKVNARIVVLMLIFVFSILLCALVIGEICNY